MNSTLNKVANNYGFPHRMDDLDPQKLLSTGSGSKKKKKKEQKTFIIHSTTKTELVSQAIGNMPKRLDQYHRKIMDGTVFLIKLSEWNNISKRSGISKSMSDISKIK